MADIPVELQGVCRKIYTTSKDLVSWRWDDRFQAALCELPAFESADFMNILSDNFPYCWDSSTIDSAPTRIRDLTREIGGILEGQLIFASSSDNETPAIGAFWPWRNSEIVSVRVFPICSVAPDRKDRTLYESFKSWFGLC